MKPVSLLALSLTTAVSFACALSARAAGSQDDLPRHRLTVDPAPEPRPALKYVFLHPAIDQTPGNAAIAYQRALELHRQNARRSEHEERIRDWGNCSLAELPKAEVAQVLGEYRTVLEELRRASRCEQCDWQIPVREQGMSVLLPHLGAIRHLGRLLAVQIRLDLAQGHYEAAIDDTRVGLSLARHVGTGATLIEGLVGVAIANQMLQRVEELIQQPQAPNLYWALTDLPPGFINVWQATRWEHSSIYAALPTLHRADRQRLSTADVYALVGEMRGLTGGFQGGPFSEQDLTTLAITAGGLAVYPRAKQFLAEQGVSAAELESMPVAEVLIRFVRDTFEIQRDNLFKWFGLPYAQAHAGLARAGREVETAIHRDPVGNFLAGLMLPALGKASARFAELDRKFALLRCIEAIRMRAAAHARLPGSLADIAEVPVPADPITAEPFPYRVDGNIALLQLPPVPGGKPATGAVYELELRK